MTSRIKVMACTPRVFLGSPYKNIQKITDCIENAKSKSVQMILFPESALTGATLGDLAYFPNMLEREEDALNMLISASCDYNGGIVIGQKDKVLYIKAGNIQKVFENEPHRIFKKKNISNNKIFTLLEEKHLVMKRKSKEKYREETIQYL